MMNTAAAARAPRLTPRLADVVRRLSPRMTDVLVAIHRGEGAQLPDRVGTTVAALAVRGLVVALSSRADGPSLTEDGMRAAAAILARDDQPAAAPTPEREESPTTTCQIAYVIRETTADPQHCDRAATTAVRLLYSIEPACDECAAQYRACCGVVQTPMTGDRVVDTRDRDGDVGRVVAPTEQDTPRPHDPSPMCLVDWPRVGQRSAVRVWVKHAYLELVPGAR